MSLKRLSIDIIPEAKEEIDRLRVKSRANTLSELFRRAMALYELVIDHQAAKGKIIFESADGKQETLRVL